MMRSLSASAAIAAAALFLGGCSVLDFSSGKPAEIPPAAEIPVPQVPPAEVKPVPAEPEKLIPELPVPEPVPVPEPEVLPPPDEIYTVRAGETLWKIAEKKYGDARLWEVILKANTELLKENPDLVRPGMKLRLPVRHDGK